MVKTFNIKDPILVTIAVLILGLVLGGTYSGFSVKSPSDSGAYCYDSDQGQNVYVKGQISSAKGNAADFCNTQYIVSEYYCTSRIYFASTNLVCPAGYSCVDGACKQPKTNTPITVSYTTSVPRS